MTYVALVIGSTGAVGRELVAELVESAKCAKVIALARREIPESGWAAAFPSLNAEAAQQKLEVRRVDFDNMTAETVASTEKVDAAFCCLGTTRKDAGSAEAFRKVDLEYVTKFATLAKEASVPYFGLLTSMGANKKSWFLYPQTKGEVEENIKNLSFERTSIFRPPLLNRGEQARFVESVGLYVMPNIKVGAVAKSMVADYESESIGLKEWNHSDLKKFQ